MHMQIFLVVKLIVQLMKGPETIWRSWNYHEGDGNSEPDYWLLDPDFIDGTYVS